MARVWIMTPVTHGELSLKPGELSPEMPEDQALALVVAGAAVWDGEDLVLNAGGDADPNAGDGAGDVEPVDEEQLVLLLEGTVDEVAESLPALSDAELASLLLLEQGSAKPRKGVIEGIEAELADRAEGDGND